MGLLSEFRDFLHEQRIIGLTSAFVIGLGVTRLAQSLVNDVVMPLISPIFPEEKWATATLDLGPIAIKWGSFMSAVIYFVILAAVVFALVKLVKRINHKKKK